MTASEPSLNVFLNTLPGDARVGVAVSGGSDSMALLHLLAAASRSVCACTVHHHLRADAGEEADFVAGYCASIDVPHEVVHWHWDGQGNLQDQARRARYILLAAWASRHGLSHVALGHTADDNVETFLMGLSRGAGLDGLSGMRPMFVRGQVQFHRPLLGVRRAALRTYNRAHSVAWREDPSNENLDYQRIRMRQGLPELEKLGLSPDMILRSIDNLNATRRDVDADLAERARLRIEHGDVVIDLAWFEGAVPEHRRRVLNAALRFVSGRDYPPRAAKLARVMSHPRAPATLHGCVVLCANDELRITREVAAVQDSVVDSHAIWDRRWRAHGPHTARSELRALGEAGIAACPEGWRGLGLPRASVLASPSVWEGDELRAAPLAGWENGWSLELCAAPPTLIASILSH